MKGFNMLSSSLRRIAATVSLVTFIAVCLVIGPAAFAQSGAGTIQGTITDAASAVMPDCSVDVVNVATGVASHTVSNSTGFYSVPGLFVGTYTLTFTAKGMKKYETKLDLQDGQVAVINVKLSVGPVSEQVTVEASTVQLATYDSGTVSTELDIHRIDQLPINGRNVLALAADTVPGVEAGGTRANGMMAQAMEYTQDGAPMTDRQFGGENANNDPSHVVANVILPDPDTVQEVRFETVGSSAALSTPATVELTTKGGTNRFHGSAFETNRDNGIGIAKSRQNPSNFKAPQYIRNEFGASVGGPISIPKLYNGKDKSFFFFAFERYSLRQGVSQLEDVMTDAERNGDFSAIVVGGVQQVIYDPSTSQSAANGYARTQYAYNGHANTINPALISPLAKALFTAMPHATNQSVVPQSGQPNLTQNAPSDQTSPKYTFRLDHVFNEKNRAYLRFTYQPETVVGINTQSTNINQAASSIPYGISANYGGAPMVNISSAVQYSHIFSPTFFAETVASQQWLNSFYGNKAFNSVNYEKLLGVPNNFGNLGSPSITGFDGAWQGTQGAYGEHQIISNLDENLTKIAGKHQVQFGGRYRHERLGYLPTASQDSVTFSSTATSLNNATSCASCTALANTGVADASFFLGDADSYGQVKPSPYGAYYDNSLATYVQDNWHVSHSLTLNLGLRWEMDWAPSAHNGNIAFFDYKNDALVMPNPTSFYVTEGLLTNAIVTNLQNNGVKFETASQAGLPASGTYDNLKNFNPRLGFAWTPSFLKHGTVLRGAFGSYMYPVPIRTGIQWYTAGLPWVASYAQSYTTAQQSPDGLPNYNGRAAQTVIGGSNSSNVVNTSSINAILPYGGLTAPDPHYPGAHVINYNLTVEQPLKDGSVVRASYVYVHGYDLDQNFEPNTEPSSYIWVANTQTAPPANAQLTNPYDTTTWGGLTDSVTTGWSNNSALQLNYQRAFKHGYAYQIYGVYTSAFRVGGNAFRDSNLTPGATFLTSALPAGLNPGTLLNPSHALNRLENYTRDTAIPRYRLQYNGVVELPVGKGKHFLHNANRLVDELVGGYQVAFTGTMVSQSFQPISGSQLCFSFGCYNLGDNWGATAPFKMYKNTKITDCSGGSCLPARLWYNGYIGPAANASTGCTSSCISGLPSDYVADEAPINNTPGSHIATIIPSYGTNYVLENCSGCASSTYGFVPAGKSLQSYAPGHALNPLARSVLQGPKNAEADISLFKVFKITEGTSLRINVDAFNAFNIQGLVNPNTTTGSLTFLSSYWTPRQLQLSGRFTF